MFRMIAVSERLNKVIFEVRIRCNTFLTKIKHVDIYYCRPPTPNSIEIWSEIS